jgi:hypothetical protein
MSTGQTLKGYTTMVSIQKDTNTTTAYKCNTCGNFLCVRCTWTHNGTCYCGKDGSPRTIDLSVRSSCPHCWVNIDEDRMRYTLYAYWSCQACDWEWSDRRSDRGDPNKGIDHLLRPPSLHQHHQPQGKNGSQGSPPSNTENAWIIMGLDPKTCTFELLKEMFRLKVKTAHPDHGGSADEFNRLKKAMETVWDQLARQGKAPERG